LVEAAGLFGSAAAASNTRPALDIRTLHAKVGELTLENDFLSGALSRAPRRISVRRRPLRMQSRQTTVMLSVLVATSPSRITPAAIRCHPASVRLEGAITPDGSFQISLITQTKDPSHDLSLSSAPSLYSNVPGDMSDLRGRTGDRGDLDSGTGGSQLGHVFSTNRRKRLAS
jgi:hypothetical protein